MYEKIVLPSGLRLFLVPFDQTLSVSILIYVGTGSRYEEAKLSGISHFVEHMVFKGTKKRPTSKVISQTIDNIGGELNAGTGKDYTVYIAKVATEHWEKGSTLIADILQNSLFDPAEITKESGVIIEEINMYLDTPLRHVLQLFEELIWGSETPLGRDIAGTEQTITKFKQKDFITYIKEHYTIDNIIIGVGGNFDKKTVIDDINKLFNKLPKNKKQEAQKNTTTQTKPQLVVHRKKTEQTHFCLGFRTFPNSNPDKYVLLVLETILGGNMSSRLFTKIREDLGLAYMIGTSITQYQDVGTITVHAGLQTSNTEKALTIILKELHTLKKTKVSTPELQGAKDYLKGKLALSLDDPEGVTSWVCRQELLLGKIQPIEKINQEIEKVTANDILRISKNIFLPEKLNLAVISPTHTKKSLEKLLIV
ncbi:MAG: pitrilysin family protein [bacterium]